MVNELRARGSAQSPCINTSQSIPKNKTKKNKFSVSPPIQNSRTVLKNKLKTKIDEVKRGEREREEEEEDGERERGKTKP